MPWPPPRLCMSERGLEQDLARIGQRGSVSGEKRLPEVLLDAGRERVEPANDEVDGRRAWPCIALILPGSSGAGALVKVMRETRFFLASRYFSSGFCSSARAPPTSMMLSAIGDFGRAGACARSACRTQHGKRGKRSDPPSTNWRREVPLRGLRGFVRHESLPFSFAAWNPSGMTCRGKAAAPERMAGAKARTSNARQRSRCAGGLADGNAAARLAGAGLGARTARLCRDRVARGRRGRERHAQHAGDGAAGLCLSAMPICWACPARSTRPATAWTSSGSAGRRPDGLFSHRCTLAGEPVDAKSDFYDLAFCSSPVAGSQGELGEAIWLERAEAVMGFIETALAHPQGGFAEDTLGTLPRRQNPHMHLLEACHALPRPRETAAGSHARRQPRAADARAHARCRDRLARRVFHRGLADGGRPARADP